jgi:hypothetical protein
LNEIAAWRDPAGSAVVGRLGFYRDDREKHEQRRGSVP